MADQMILYTRRPRADAVSGQIQLPKRPSPMRKLSIRAYLSLSYNQPSYIIVLTGKNSNEFFLIICKLISILSKSTQFCNIHPCITSVASLAGRKNADESGFSPFGAPFACVKSLQTGRSKKCNPCCTRMKSACADEIFG